MKVLKILISLLIIFSMDFFCECIRVETCRFYLFLKFQTKICWILSILYNIPCTFIIDPLQMSTQKHRRISNRNSENIRPTRKLSSSRINTPSKTSRTTGPVFTYVKTDKDANVKWAVRHFVGKKYHWWL